MASWAAGQSVCAALISSPLIFAKIASLSLLVLGLVSQGVWAQGSGGKQPPSVPGRILLKLKTA
jgi:hypothetical protein